MLNQSRIFARLLAKEDIVVVQSASAKTASFNVESRKITFPIYRNMEEVNMSGFTCHEVGHALYTTEAVMKLALRFGMTVLNVVEDLRCNNRMKSEFLGVSNIFFDHYESLKNRGFFGDVTNTKMSFIDKINVANKLRINLFSTPEEKAFWDKFSDIKTYDDLVSACIYVVDFYANQEKEIPEEENSEEENSDTPEDNDTDNSEEENSDTPEDNDTDNSEEENSDDTDTETVASEESDEDDSEDDTEGSESGSEESEDEDDTDTDSGSDDSTEDDTDDSEESDDTTEGNSEESDDEAEDDTDGSESGSDESDTDEESDTEDEAEDDTDGSESGSDEESDTDEDATEGDDTDGTLKEESDDEGSVDEESDSDEGSNPEKTDSEIGNPESDGYNEGFDPDSIVSETEENFENSLQSSIGGYHNDYILPRNKDLNSNIIPYTDVSIDQDYDIASIEKDDERWGVIKQERKKLVNRMISIFNRNKSADEFHRRKFSDSGSLNMSKLHQYKTSDDVFLRNMRVTEGKNHGVVFFLDTSGSMAGAEGTTTVKQIGIMVEFCRQTNIPYSVLGFADDTKYQAVEANEIHSDTYNIELLNNRQSKKVHNDTLYCLYRLFKGNTILKYKAPHNKEYERTYGLLPSTPLFKTIINSVGFIDKFKKENKVQIMNIMYFTDGGDSEGGIGGSSWSIQNIVDAETKQSFKNDRLNNGDNNFAVYLANIVGNRFNSNAFFFYAPSYGAVQKVGFKIFGENTKARNKKHVDKLINNGFLKVESGCAVEHYILSCFSYGSLEFDYNNFGVTLTKSGKIAKSGMDSATEEITNVINRRKSGMIFAELVGKKIAEGMAI